MLEFAKTLGIGLLTVILSPLIVLMFVVYLIYTITLFPHKNAYISEKYRRIVIWRETLS